LLTESQRGCFDIVLVSPRNPLNIGAAARAMANFGFSRLTVVAPYEEHWREAKSAVGASDLLLSAKRVERLAEAVADCTFVVGTGSLARRKPEQLRVPLPELAPLLHRRLDLGGRIALVFGSEKRGLSRDDLAQCHVITVIPTEPAQPSMNLGQAVAVCLYEIASRPFPPASESGALRNPGAFEELGAPGALHLGTWDSKPSAPGSPPPASNRDLELLAGVIEQTMLAAKYSPAAMRNANRHDLELLLRRLALNGRDTTRMFGFFRRILWRLTR
jgi:tRNA/rRNA methyltransferase